MAFRDKNKLIGINMKKEQADEIKKRASSMQISMGAYCRIILGQWMDSGRKLRLEEK